MSIIEYSDWEDELERFLAENNVGIMDMIKYDGGVDTAVRIHMKNYCLKYNNGDPSRMEEIKKESDMYLERYLLELRGGR